MKGDTKGKGKEAETFPEKIKNLNPKTHPWMARIFALIIGIMDGGIILLFKLGMDRAMTKFPPSGFNIISPSHWTYVIINPYILIAIVLSFISMAGMTGIFSHDKSHRLFSIIGGISYITIVVGSWVVIGETIDPWVLFGVGIIILSLFMANIYQFVRRVADQVPIARK